MTQRIVRIEISRKDSDDSEVYSMTNRLRADLSELDLISIDSPRASEFPAGAKSGTDLALLGVLMLTAPNSAVLSGIAKVIQGWLGRDSERSARLELDGDSIDLHGVSRSDQQRLIDTWLVRHRD